MNKLYLLGVCALLVMLIACLLPGILKHDKNKTVRGKKYSLAFRPLSALETFFVPFVISMRTLASNAQRVFAPSRLIGHGVALRCEDNSDKLPALKARKTQLEQDVIALKGKDQTDADIVTQLQNSQTELESVDAQIESAELKARNATLELAITQQRTKDADHAVQQAIKRGAIAPKDTELQATWQKRCTEDPDNIGLLAKMKGSPALDRSQAPAKIFINGGGVGIIREDSLVCLKAYSMERDPEKKGALYAKELSERIASGEGMPIRAANTLGTLAGEIVAQRALELLTVEEPMLDLFSTDFSDEEALIDIPIKCRIVGIPTAGRYHVDNGYVSQAAVMVDVSVTPSVHGFTQAEFGANELSGTGRKLFDEIAPAQADAIGADAIQVAMAVLLAANFTEDAIVKALINFGRKAVIAMAGALRDRGVKRDKFLLLRGDYYDALFTDETIALLAANQKQELVTDDQMIPIHGFKVVRCSTLPAVENLQGFGGGKSSVVIAGRVPADYANALPGVSGGGTSQVIKNVKSGLSVHLVQFVDHKLGKAYSRMAYILGAAKGQQKAGQRLVSQ